MELQISKWGNSLAMRLPAEVARRLGLREGDSVQAQLTDDSALTIRPKKWDRRAFAAELRAMQKDMPVTESVIEQMRREARY